MSSQDDSTLLRQFANTRSEEAFRLLVSRYGALVYSTCRRQLFRPDLAEDATQAVFLLLAQKAPRLQVNGTLASWLYVTSRNISKALARQELKRMNQETELHENMASKSDDFVLRVLLMQAVDKLSTKDREAIILRYWQGLSLAEVGEKQGSTETATRSRVDRALARLRKRLSARGASIDPSQGLPLVAMPMSATFLHSLESFNPATAAPRIVEISKAANTIMSTTLKMSLAAGLAATVVTGSLGYVQAHATAKSRLPLAPPVAAKSPAISALITAGLQSFPETGPYRLQINYVPGLTMNYHIAMQSSTVEQNEQVINLTLKVVKVHDGQADIDLTTRFMNSPEVAMSTDPTAGVVKTVRVQQDVTKFWKMQMNGMPILTFPDHPVSAGDTWAAPVPSSPDDAKGSFTFKGMQVVNGKRLAELGMTLSFPNRISSGAGTVILDQNGQVLSWKWSAKGLPNDLGIEAADQQTPVSAGFTMVRL